MKALDFIAIALFVLTLITLPIFLLNSFFYIYRRHAKSGALPKGPPVKSLKALLIPIAVLFGICFLSVTSAREQVLHSIDSVSANCTVSVNGRVAQNPTEVLQTLNHLYCDWGHHSNATKRISVVISDKSTRIVLTLARRSENP